MEYDTLNRPAKRVEAVGELGYITLWGYELGSLTTSYVVVSVAYGSYEYRQNGRGFVSVDVFDEDNNRVASYDELGRVTRYTYNRANQLIRVTQPGGGIIEQPVDGRGRARSSLGPTVEYVQFKYY